MEQQDLFRPHGPVESDHVLVVQMDLDGQALGPGGKTRLSAECRVKYPGTQGAPGGVAGDQDTVSRVAFQRLEVGRGGRA